MVLGYWSDALVNSIHLVWFVSLLCLLFGALTRFLGAAFGFLGVYFLVSLPLFLIHGVNAYTDVLTGAQLFLPFLFLYEWVTAESRERQRTAPPPLSTFSAAMLFVKSEALLLFLPPLTLILGISAWRKSPSFSSFGKTMGIFLGMVSCIALPWIIFKSATGLEFGNAQAVGQFTLSPNPAVPSAIGNDLLYTGSYLLFFPVLLILLGLSHRTWLRNPVLPLVAFLAIVLLGEFLIYYLTPLAAEAIRHTGYGRGIVQLLPSLTFVAMLLLHSIIAPSIDIGSRHLPSLVSNTYHI